MLFYVKQMGPERVISLDTIGHIRNAIVPTPWNARRLKYPEKYKEQSKWNSFWKRLHPHFPLQRIETGV
ncbi:hypothetical protein SAMN05443144_105115 [Fodinibius roseus]|uniref:Uncharacterized protein n=1 Tax=Fodinibius roseus TaxID=1194090 RepID=A0A1M4YNH4_9BACT|nr:hypothetical protein SAMN05443144_105115 [Fodinibius roseus]